MRAAHPTTLLTWIGAPDPMEIERADCAGQGRSAQRHDSFTIGVIEHGSARVRYRGWVETLRPGGLIVIAPGEVYAHVPQAGTGWRHRLVRPSASLLRRLARVSDASGSGMAQSPWFAHGWYADEELATRFAAAHAALEEAARGRSDEAPTLVATLLGDVLGTLVRRHGRIARLAPAMRTFDADDGARRAVHRTIDFLHAHLGQRVRLAQLAEVAGMGSFALIRCFGRIVGVPPYAYLELLRIERAKQLLRDGVAITDVAYTTGFSDQSHLTRHFRRVVGVPPGQYVRAHAARMVQRAARRVA